jgi:hypothetical protein
MRQTTDRLRLALEEMDRKDPGWRLEEVLAARAAVPEGKNSGLIVMEVSRLLPEKWPPATTDDLSRIPPQEQYSAADFARLEAELKPLEAPLELARRLAWMPDGRLPLEYARTPIATLLPWAQEVRRETTLLTLDARRHAQARRMKEAIQSCQAALNCGRCLGDEPIMISQLVRIACVAVTCQAVERTLAQGEPDPKDLEELQRLLELEDTHNALLVAMWGERAGLERVFELIESGELGLGGLDGAVRGGDSRSLEDKYFSWWTVSGVRAEHPLFLSLMTRFVEAAKLPLHEQAAAERAVEEELKAQSPWSVRVTRLLVPAVNKFGDATRRHHANVRSMLVTIAAERYRRAEGHWPATLNDLAPKFVGAVPLDPYDGKPLRYRKLPDGVVVYSVGLDGTDDSGHIDRENPVGKRTDLGYRLWDVKHRRQPQSPAPAVPAGGGPR